MYDEAKIQCKGHIGGIESDPDYDPEDLDKVSGKLSVLNLQLSWGMILKKTTVEGRKHLSILGKLPCYLCNIEDNSGESLNHGIENQEALAIDDRINTTFARIVDIHNHDECGSNMRLERWREIVSKAAELEEPGGPSKASLCSFCYAHKKAQTISETLKVLSPVDTICIRMQLSLQGPVKRHIRRLFRRLICTHLISIDGSPPPEVDDFRVRFYNLVFFGSAYDRYRKHLCEALFNGTFFDVIAQGPRRRSSDSCAR